MLAGSLLGLLIVAGLYGLGWAIGKSGNPTTITVGTNNPEADCDEACSQYDARRSDRCNAEKDQVTTQARVDGLRSTMLAMIAAGISLAVAAAGAATIPVFGTAVAAALAVAAAAFFAIATVLAGQVGAAETDLATKAKAAQDARQAEASARALLGTRCPPEKADACLLRPSPC